MRGARTVIGLALYTAGAVAALVWIATVAVADTALVRVEGPAAPALELGPGVYEVRTSEGSGGAGDANAAASAVVFALGTRAQVPLRSSAGGGTFEVLHRGIYVVDLPAGAGASSVHEQQRLVVSPTLIFALGVAPLATLPGVFTLEVALPARNREVLLGGSRFRVASVRRRLVGVVLDLVVIAVILLLALLVAPMFRPMAPLIPLVPVAYVWAGNARGSTVGRWLAGTRVLNADGRPPGAGAGLLRSAGWMVSWGLLGAGYAFVAWRSSGRAPHDALAGTVVVYD